MILAELDSVAIWWVRQETAIHHIKKALRSDLRKCLKYASRLSHACHIYRPSYPPFVHPNDICWGQ